MKQNNTNIKPYLRQFYRGNGIYLTFAFLQTIILTAANLLVSWLIQQIIDMTTGMDIGFAFWEIVGLAVVGIGLVVLSFAFAYISKPKFVSKAIAQYKNYVFGELSKKSISAFSGENSSVYISALSNDMTTIETGYLCNLFIIVDQAVMFVGALALMFYYSPLLTGISIGLAVFPLAVSVITGNLVAVAEKKVSDKNEGYMSTLRDSLVGFSVVKSFRAEAQMCRIFAQEVKAVSDAKTRRRKMALLVQMLSVTAGNILQLGVFLIGAYLALSGSNISAGSVLIFVQLLNYIINPIGSIPQALAECKASKALIVKLADALCSNVRQEGDVTKSKLTDAITVEDLCFAYEPEKPILNNINFRFEAEKSYCLVGASGSGKSTLLNLLMASHNDFGGRIAYDCTDIHDIAGEALYDMVSLVQQNVFVFNASIRENITMFSDFPESEVDRAIEMSGLSELIRERGEDYECGENGSGLSGGEKQRISIARSLLKKSQVFLVDEATAALDAQTAYQVSSSILDLEGMTRIVVTHAMDETLLSRYDCIIALKNGTIVESGSFDELIKHKGYFYSLYTVSQ